MALWPLSQAWALIRALRESILSSMVFSRALRTSSLACCNRSRILRSRRTSMSG